MQNYYIYILLIFILSFSCRSAQQNHKSTSVPAISSVIKMLQPNGDTINVRLWGDENYNYLTTEDGYLITKNKEGYYIYHNSKIKVNNINNRTIKEKRHLKKTEKIIVK